MTFACQSLRIRFEPSEGSMAIDLSTVVQLELIQNLQNVKSKDSLFGLLNETLTPMGSRLLRANILQPLTQEAKLLARYDAVEDLSTSEAMFIAVRQGSYCAKTSLVIAKILGSTQGFRGFRQGLDLGQLRMICLS